MSYSTTLNSKINNLDVISENTHSGTRIKKTEETMKILQNMKKIEKNTRRYGSYIYLENKMTIVFKNYSIIFYLF